MGKLRTFLIPKTKLIFINQPVCLNNKTPIALSVWPHKRFCKNVLLPKRFGPAVRQASWAALLSSTLIRVVHKTACLLFKSYRYNASVHIKNVIHILCFLSRNVLPHVRIKIWLLKNYTNVSQHRSGKLFIHKNMWVVIGKMVKNSDNLISWSMPTAHPRTEWWFLHSFSPTCRINYIRVKFQNHYLFINDFWPFMVVDIYFTWSVLHF